MKRAAKTVMLVFLVCLLGVFVGQAQAEGPKLLIPQTSFDFGYTPPQSVISHYYMVKNVGEGILKIENVKPG